MNSLKIRQGICLSVCLSVYLSTGISLPLSVCVSIFISFHLINWYLYIIYRYMLLICSGIFYENNPPVTHDGPGMSTCVSCLCDWAYKRSHVIC